MIVKKKWFEEIKSGRKDREFRDPHITFVCEETGEKFRAEVEGVGMEPSHKVKKLLGNPPDFGEMFRDDRQIVFEIRKGGRQK